MHVRLITLAATAALAVGLATAGAAQAASAEPTYGPGITVAAGSHHSGDPSVHAGAWTYGSLQMDCVDYGKGTPDGAVRVADAGSRANWILNAYPKATSSIEAAARWDALNRLIGNAAFRADEAGIEARLPLAVRVEASAMLAQSLTAGPYRVSVAASGVIVLGRNGRPAADVAVTRSGDTVTVTGPSWRHAYGNTPSHGRQHVWGGGILARTVYTIPAPRPIIPKPTPTPVIPTPVRIVVTPPPAITPTPVDSTPVVTPAPVVVPTPVVTPTPVSTPSTPCDRPVDVTPPTRDDSHRGDRQGNDRRDDSGGRGSGCDGQRRGEHGGGC